MPTIQLGFVICIVIHGILFSATIGAYFFQRHNFPIAQRIPVFVTVELLFLAGKSVFILFQGAIENQASIIKRCYFYYLGESLLEDVAYILLAARVGWLFFKDFTTKALLQKISARQNPELEKAKEKSLAFRFLSRQITIMGPNLSLLCYLFPVIAFALTDFINVAVNAPRDALVTDATCGQPIVFSSMFDIALLTYYTIFGIFVSFSLRNLKDNFNLFVEFRALAVPVSFQLMVTTGLTISQSIPPFIHLLSGALVTPSFIYVQTLYPLKLVMDHRRARQHIAEKKAKTANQTMTETLEELRLFVEVPESREILLKFLEAEFSVENLYFIMCCIRLEKLLIKEVIEKEEILKHLREIKGTFIDTLAPNPVNLSSATKQEIYKELNAAQLDIEKIEEIFSEAKEEIFRLMARDSFKRFQFSEAYLGMKDGQPQKMKKEQSEEDSSTGCFWFKKSKPSTKLKAKRTSSLEIPLVEGAMSSELSQSRTALSSMVQSHTSMTR
jgi:hypothetical protein